MRDSRPGQCFMTVRKRARPPNSAKRSPLSRTRERGLWVGVARTQLRSRMGDVLSPARFHRWALRLLARPRDSPRVHDVENLLVSEHVIAHLGACQDRLDKL
jgi:hypothetical protein